MPPARSIGGLGPADLVPKINEEYDLGAGGFTPEEFFVFSRVDGRTPLGHLCLISGFPEERTVSILKKLRGEGAILFPGDTPPKKKAKAAAAARAEVPPGAKVRPAPPLQPDLPAKTEQPAPDAPAVDPSRFAAELAEEADLTKEQKLSILAKFASLDGATHFEVLGVRSDASKKELKKELKRTYFKLSKEFHPDRFYGKSLGSFKQKLAAIFERVTSAFEVLNDDIKRGIYERSLTPGGAEDLSTATPVERAALLFEKACQDQVMGDFPEALRAFAEAVRLDPQGRTYRRAADCAIVAQELIVAEEYAKKATELDSGNAIAHRTLAKVYRKTGRLEDAKRELELASKLDPESEHIAAELEEIRGLVGRPA
ncbi:MAG: DnaJ domain-containing protein [Deltaproteobacteria bacterium]|nr:DnaJ domain-containing protein [Deltaproteobacteria bacterium]